MTPVATEGDAPGAPPRTTLAGLRAGRGEAGLTTLEWLLIVAAVAALAALAVVLIQSVVNETAEQVETSEARQVAADLAVTELQRRWQAETPTASTIDEINEQHATRCRQLAIIYADISLKVQPPKLGTLHSSGTGWGTRVPQCALA